VSEIVYLGFGPSLVTYREGWDLQRRVHAGRVADEVPDSCLLLQHEPVYTAGKRTAASDRPLGDPGAPVIDVDRGGKITWHGPGQLTGYPIIKLREPLDVVAYVRALEEAMIRACADFGVTAVRVEGRSGAWIRGGGPDAQGLAGLVGPAGDGSWPDRKVGAIGARVARGVTMHGFALNCDCDLSWYDRIVPCGIRDAGVTTLTAEAGRRITVDEVTPAVERHLAEALGYHGWRRVAGPECLAGVSAGPNAQHAGPRAPVGAPAVPDRGIKARRPRAGHPASLDRLPSPVRSQRGWLDPGERACSPRPPG
jgi:lipoyl(octanoyl) transferase